jgi:O-antigen ligase
MTLNNILKYVIYVGLFAILFIPLFVSGTLFFPFVSGKNFLFRIIVEIIFVAWAILATQDIKYRPKKSGILWAFIAFIGIIAVADLFGENPYRSFWSNFERMEGLITHLHLFVYFFVMSSVFLREKLWERFFQTSLGVSVIIGGYGLLQLAGKLSIHQGGTRLDASFGNATYLAVYALFHIFIGLFLLYRHSRNMFAWFIYGFIIILNTFILYHTATRGAILGLIGGTLLTALLISILEKNNKTIKRLSVGVIIAVVLLVSGFMLAKDTSFVRSSQVLNRFSSISLTETTTKSRFMVWGMAIEGAKEHPILGWGQENFNILFNKYYNPSMYGQEPFFDRAHNVFLDWLTAGGVLGLTAYLSLFFFALFYIWRRQNGMSVVEKSILTGLLGGYFFHNLFVFDNLTSYILFFSILGYVHVRYILNIDEDEESGNELQNTSVDAHKMKWYIISSVAIILSVFTMYFSNIKGVLAGKTLIQAMSKQSEKGVSENLRLFKKTLGYNTFLNQEAREQLVSITGKISSTQKIPQKDKSEFIKLSNTEIINQIKKAPNDARYELLAGVFLNSLGSYSEAIPHLKRAVELSPGKQAIYFELGNSYINKGEVEKAFKNAEYAYNLEKTNNEALNVYAVTALYAKKVKLAKELILSKYGTLLVDDNRFLNAYAKTGFGDLVVGIWEKRISDLKKEGKDNPQYHLSLAASYLNIGKRNSSILEIEKVIKLNPKFKDQGEYYIKEIKAGRNP